MRANKFKFSVAIGAALVGAAAVGRVTAAESHPDMRAALQNLEQARDHLSTAAHDFHGYRQKALTETNTAINDVQKALESDR